MIKIDRSKEDFQREMDRNEEKMEQDKIMFTTEEGDQIPFYVIEQTMIAGNNYLLVTDGDEEEEESDAYIMREVTDEDDQIVYELIDDENELAAISKVFEELLEDIDIEF